MASRPLAVFLRAVNLGGRSLKTKPFAESLGLVNLGAAGTFVSFAGIEPKTLAATVRRKLPFETEVYVCGGEKVLALLRGSPFGPDADAASVTRFVSILASKPKPLPRFPIEEPAGPSWQIRLVGLAGPFALSLRRPREPRPLYPNAVVEKRLGVSATTRNWNTIVSLVSLLQPGGDAPRAAKD